MEGKIYPIFPKAVMKFKLDREFTDSEILHFSKIKKTVQISAHSDGISFDKYVLNDDSMKSLKDFCENCLNSYIEEIYSPSLNLSPKAYITQSWINYLRKGYPHSVHAHPNSFLSGCLYMDMANDVDSIEFVKNDYSPIQFYPPKNINDFNTLEVAFKVKKYDIIIFPSSLYHQVPSNENNELRISLAFNSFIKGTIGSEDTLLGLKL
jgi:ectoine hydroxylase-related dioxygenase (phytanoyl-CoA dioxygenase family)